MVKIWNPVTDVYDGYPLDPFAADSAVVHDTGDETIAGVKTFSSDPIIPDEVYGVGWNGSLEPPTKNAVYDKIETIGGGSVDDTAYDATTWNGVTTTAPSKNAVRDKIELLAPLANPTFTGNVVVPDADAATEAMNRQTSDARYVQIAAGQVVQVVSAQSTTTDNTTSTSFQSSSLSATITPQFSNSIILAEVTGDVQIDRVAGSTTERRAQVAIQNTTDAAQIALGVRGVTLVTASSATGRALGAIALRGRYTVNSTTARTFELQYASIEATNVQASIIGGTPRGPVMTLTEIRA